MLKQFSAQTILDETGAEDASGELEDFDFEDFAPLFSPKPKGGDGRDDFGGVDEGASVDSEDPSGYDEYAHDNPNAPERKPGETDSAFASRLEREAEEKHKKNIEDGRPDLNDPSGMKSELDRQAGLAAENEKYKADREAEVAQKRAEEAAAKSAPTDSGSSEDAALDAARDAALDAPENKEKAESISLDTGPDGDIPGNDRNDDGQGGDGSMPAVCPKCKSNAVGAPDEICDSCKFAEEDDDGDAASDVTGASKPSEVSDPGDKPPEVSDPRDTGSEPIDPGAPGSEPIDPGAPQSEPQLSNFPGSYPEFYDYSAYNSAHSAWETATADYQQYLSDKAAWDDDYADYQQYLSDKAADDYADYQQYLSDKAAWDAAKALYDQYLSDLAAWEASQ